MAIQIRRANKGDLGEIVALNDAVQMHPWSFQSLQEELENPDHCALVAVDGLKLVGYLLARESCESVDILLIGVLTDAMRQGIGRALIESLKKEVNEGLDFFLEVSSKNTGAIRFYEAMGFKIYLIRRAYYRDGSDALCFKLNLANL